MKSAGLDTCHSRECVTRSCCNPNHLRFDTRQSNVDDMIATRGPNRGHARLTDRQVETIRTRIANGATQQALANEYGVSGSYISMIKTGKRRAS